MISNIVFVGTHSSQTTGYARVTKRLARALSDLGPRVHVFGVQGRGKSEHDDPIAPARAGKLPPVPEDSPAPGGVWEVDAAALEAVAGAREGGFYYSGLRHFVDARGADAVVIFNDPVVVGGYLHALESSSRVRAGAAKVFVYLDLVSDGVHERHWATLAHPLVRGIAVMAEHWRRELLKLPVALAPVRVVPHAVDTPRMPRAEARRLAGWTAPATTPEAIGEDALVFLNMNRNTPRKRLDLYAAAAARFLAARPGLDALFLANSNQESTFDLHSVALRELVALGVPRDRHAGILDRIRVNRAALPDAAVDALHNACDVAVNCAEAEGFGLVALEAAAVGKPVIASAVGPVADFFSARAPTAPDAAVLLPPAAEYWLDDSRDGVGGRARLVRVDDLVRAFEMMTDPASRTEYGRRAEARVRAMPGWAEIARTMLDFLGS